MLQFYATGSFPYYYCMIMADGNLPVLDILSSCHEAAWIHGLMLSFNSSVRRLNGGRLVTSRYFSYALMHACIQAFNKGMQLVGYLQLTYDILTRRCTRAQMKNVSFVCLCAAHMLKALSMRLSRAVPKKDSEH